MKNKHIIAGFVALFFTSFLVTSCLNKDNKIPPNCFDGELNNGEERVDCGGPCVACNHCTNNVFEPELGETCCDCGGECGECPPCFNCIMDGDEVAIDCGGSCNVTCESLCDDNLLNGDEDEVDCGGYCTECPTCTDELLNGDEVGIDCGGSECPPCIGDNNCTNGIMEGDELWIDCGGVNCPDCDTVLTWVVGDLTHVCMGDDVTVEFEDNGDDPDVLTVTGNSLQGGQITIQITEPLVGWENNADLFFTPALSDDNVIAFVSPEGDTYSSSNEDSYGEGGIIAFTMPADGIARIWFECEVFDNDEEESKNLTDGLMMVPLN